MIHYAVLIDVAGNTRPLCDGTGTSDPDPWKVTCLACLKAGRFNLHPRDDRGRFMKTARHKEKSKSVG